MKDIWVNIIIFGILTAPILWLSLRSLKSHRNHGFYRFFAWELMAWLLVSNFRDWFRDVTSVHQLVSWFLLIISIYPVLDGLYRFKTAGRINRQRNDPTLFGFEHTTELITTGVYRFIRHPMYASLLYLTWGIALKRPEPDSLIIGAITSLLLLLTVLAEEKENRAYFGDAYRQYMKRSKRFIPFVFSITLLLLPVSLSSQSQPDWLIDNGSYKSRLDSSTVNRLVLTNGLISRTFLLKPDCATIGLDNLEKGVAMLRGVKPEAIVTIDGTEYKVGGLTGQPNCAYLTEEWIAGLKAVQGGFTFEGYLSGPINERIAWKQVRHSAPDAKWPPDGIHVEMKYRPPLQLNQRNLKLSVHYEIYDGIPLICKWISIENASKEPVRIEKCISEILAVVEKDSPVEDRGVPMKKPDLFVETDYEFSGMETLNTTLHSVFWVNDPDYSTQVNYNRNTPCQLEVRPETGPDQLLQPGGRFESPRAWELVTDPFDLERKSLAQRKMYRVIAPWVTENPIMMHVRFSDDERMKTAIDQCAEVGFEMAIMTFGSGLDIENTDPAYIAHWKELTDYAHSKGIELGGYSLLSSRRIDDANDVVNPATGKTGGVIHGNAPCLGSEWGRKYMDKLYNWYKATGMNLLEHDGSYPGHICASTAHPGHRGTDDSQWNQWRIITDFYKWCLAQGIYLNIPDWYYLNGGTKCGMGYREVNWSLPREQQLIHSRQNIYDGTREKTPSMGWMFVPLTEYHGGGAAATIEPLKDHLQHYAGMLAANLGNGVQACYRGPRLYDTDSTKEVVRQWVDFYKKHRDILESDVIHSASRRADGRDLDWMFHANPSLTEKGCMLVFNPTDKVIRRTLHVNVYYTGLIDKANVRINDGKPLKVKVSRDYYVDVEVEVGPNGTCFVTFQ
jgi:protein-S-isoprenylcysteine O-methyltransferase Ste14